jgi:hypothetical protein
MCLLQVTSGKNQTATGVGYKAFCKKKSGLTNLVIASIKVHPVYTWIQDEEIDFLSTSDCVDYQTGFHIFEKKEDAEEFAKCFNEWFTVPKIYGIAVVRKVYYRNVTARGTNQTFLYVPRKNQPLREAPCIVAREIFIQ